MINLPFSISKLQNFPIPFPEKYGNIMPHFRYPPNRYRNLIITIPSLISRVGPWIGRVVIPKREALTMMGRITLQNPGPGAAK